MRDLLRASVQEMFGRPAPGPVLYLRCDRFGQVARHGGMVEAILIRGDDRDLPTVATPPKTVCPLCRYAQPRMVGDEIVSTSRCGAATGGGWQLRWQRCAIVHVVRAAAVRIACRAAGTTTDRPAA